MPFPSLSKRTWIVLFAVIIIAVSASGIVGIAWYLKRKAPHDANTLAQAGLEAAARNDHVRALVLFANALAKNPAQLSYAEAAAQEAFLAGRKPEARVYAQRAWDGGIHTFIVLQALLGTAEQMDARKSLVEADRLLASIPDETDRLSLRADLLTTLGLTTEAETTWRLLIVRRPEPALITRYAHILMDRQRPSEALKVFTDARAAGHLDGEGYYDLIGLTYSQKLQAATKIPEPSGFEELFALVEEARAHHLDDDRLHFIEAQLRYAKLELPASLAILTDMSVPGQNTADNRWRLQARLLRVVILHEMGREGEIAQLQKIPRPSGPEREGEDELYEAFSSISVRHTERLAAVARVQKLLGQQSSLTLLEARLRVANGERMLALQSYQQIQGLLVGAAGPLLEQALLLGALGKRDDAIGCVTLVHRFTGTTQRSLVILADLVGTTGAEQTAQLVESALVSAARQDPKMLAAGAEFALGRGHYQVAQELFAEINRNDPSNNQATLGPARICLSQQDWAGALSKCEHLPPSIQVETVRALAYRGLGRFDDALSSFAVVTANPHPWQLDVEDGGTAILAGRFDRAQLAATRALKSAPGNPAVDELVAAVALIKGDPAEALESIKHALAGGRNPYREMLRVQALMDLSRHQEAYSIVQTALRTAADHPGLLLQSSSLKMRLGKVAEAHQELLVLDQQHPMVLAIERALVECSARLGDGAGALKRLDGLLVRYPDSTDLLILRVQTIARNGDIPAARKALGDLPESTEAVSSLLLAAWIDGVAGDSQAAIARLVTRLDDQRVALAWARAILESHAPSPPLVAPVLGKFPVTLIKLQELVILAEKHSRWQDAAALCHQALVLSPDDPALLNNWSWYAMQLPDADLDPILAALEKARRLMPSNQNIVDTYAEANLRANRPIAARNAITELGDLAHKDAQLQHDLGRALEALADHRGAFAAFQRSYALAAPAPVWPLRESRAVLSHRIADGVPK